MSNVRDTARERILFLTATSTKAITRSESAMAEECINLRLVIDILVNTKSIEDKAKVYLYIQMAQNILVTCQRLISTKAISKMESVMDPANMSMPMVIAILVFGKMI